MPTGLIQCVAYFVASGDAFFVGALLIAVGHSASWRFRHRRRAKYWLLLTVIGVVLCGAAVIPLPMALLGLCLGLPVLLIRLPFENPKTTWRFTELRRLQPLVECLLLVAIVWELVIRAKLSVKATDILSSEIHVIGDSISAGIDDERESLWPHLVSERLNIAVVNHAQPGATTESAMKQAEQINCDTCCVVVEIGGNDFLGGRDMTQVDRDLTALLVRVARPGRTIVMFELPVVPIPGAYDFARLQRRLAHQFGVRLISRRSFAKVLFSDEATIDSLHLSRVGHQRLAELVSEFLRSVGRVDRK